VLALSVSVTLLAAAGVSAAGGGSDVVSPVVPAVPGTTFSSDNVEHVGTVPLDGVGVSMDVKTVDGQVRAFVSGAGGLSIYDATDPAKPLVLGHLPIYNFENEDIAVSDDGKTAFLTEFTANGYLHAVDVSDPRVPVITDTIVGQGPHTVMCANAACTHLYGSNGRTFDVSNRADIKILPIEQGWGRQVGVGGGHNVHRDAAGVFVSDTNPLTVFRQLDGDPTRIQKLAEGRISLNSNYQHNNIRPRADRYVPRTPEEGLEGPLRDGELLLGNGESNFTRTCAGNAGAFSTWSMAGFDQQGLGETGFGADMQQLDVLRPVSGSFQQGDAPVNGLGCSGHWFTETDAQDGSILVFAGWYEHGTRVIKVDPATGKIRQVGFFQPVRGSTSEAFLMPGSKDGEHVVWTVDFHSGIDILRFTEDAELEPSTADLDESWMLRAGQTDVFSIAMRELCLSGDDATSAQRAAAHHALPAPAAQTVTRVQRAALPTF
jgi:hypothetical protein